MRCSVNDTPPPRPHYLSRSAKSSHAPNITLAYTQFLFSPPHFENQGSTKSPALIFKMLWGGENWATAKAINGAMTKKNRKNAVAFFDFLYDL